MDTPEAAVKRALKKWLTTRGFYQFWPVQTGWGKRGIDCYACMAGEFIAFECKAYGEKPTGLQRKILRDVDASGGFACLVTFDAEGKLEFSPFFRAKLSESNVLQREAQRRRL